MTKCLKLMLGQRHMKRTDNGSSNSVPYSILDMDYTEATYFQLVIPLWLQ